MNKMTLTLLLTILVVASAARRTQAQGQWQSQGLTEMLPGAGQYHRFYYYPYYYFPHSYWPGQGPRYPERPGEPYQRPPAYMAYPTHLEPNWTYMLWKGHPYHRGNHFWLDQF